MANNAIIILSVDHLSELGIDECCEACHVSHDYIYELVAHGVLNPKGSSVETWRFNPEHVLKIKRAVRLQQDLEINVAGAALALDLIEQVNRLQRQVALLEKYFAESKKYS